MIAIDAPVLVELLTDGPQADAAEACLRQCLVGGRVVVAEVLDLERPWQDDQQQALEHQLAERMMMNRAQRILADYFRFDAVKRRLDFRNPGEKPA